MKKNEEFNQIFVASFLRKVRKEYGNFFQFSHPPHGGNRSAREGARFKAMGTLAGVCDLQIWSRSKDFFIELKLENGKLSRVQIDFINTMEDFGKEVFVVYEDYPKETVEAVAEIMLAMFPQLDQKGISGISSQVIASPLAGGGKASSSPS